jgi:hypothetical protein
MRKDGLSIIAVCILSMAMSVPTFAYESKEVEEMTPTEIETKKERVAVPEKIDNSIENYVQSKEDFYSVLSKDLPKDSYGGMYVDDGVLHINAINNDEVYDTIKLI